MPSVTKHSIICPSRCPVTYRRYRYIIHNEHNNRKNRKCKPTVCYNTVNLIRCCKLLRSVLLATICYYRRNIYISFICNNTFCIIIKCILKSIDLIRHIWNCTKLFYNLIISFKKLDCKKTLLFFRNLRT